MSATNSPPPPSFEFQKGFVINMFNFFSINVSISLNNIDGGIFITPIFDPRAEKLGKGRKTI